MRLLSLPVLALVTTLTAVGCASPAEEDSGTGTGAVASPGDNVRASSKVDLLSEVIEIKSVENGEALTLRLYELGGGDPAANGNHLWLGVQGSPSEGALAFDLGLDVLFVESVTSPAKGSVVITGQESADDEGNTRDFEATIAYSVRGTTLAPTIRVTKGAETKTVQKSSRAGADILASAYKVQASHSPGMQGRVYTASGGGDPARNGAKVYLSLTNFPEGKAYDLGLDVADVKGLSMPENGVVHIDVDEDVAPGETKSFRYTVTYTMNDEAAPSETVSVAKAPR